MDNFEEKIHVKFTLQLFADSEKVEPQFDIPVRKNKWEGEDEEEEVVVSEFYSIFNESD